MSWGVWYGVVACGLAALVLLMHGRIRSRASRRVLAGCAIVALVIFAAIGVFSVGRYIALAPMLVAASLAAQENRSQDPGTPVAIMLLGWAVISGVLGELSPFFAGLGGILIDGVLAVALYLTYSGQAVRRGPA